MTSERAVRETRAHCGDQPDGPVSKIATGSGYFPHCIRDGIVALIEIGAGAIAVAVELARERRGPGAAGLRIERQIEIEKRLRQRVALIVDRVAQRVGKLELEIGGAIADHRLPAVVIRDPLVAVVVEHRQRRIRDAEKIAEADRRAQRAIHDISAKQFTTERGDEVGLNRKAIRDAVFESEESVFSVAAAQVALKKCNRLLRRPEGERRQYLQVCRGGGLKH